MSASKNFSLARARGLVVPWSLLCPVYVALVRPGLLAVARPCPRLRDRMVPTMDWRGQEFFRRHAHGPVVPLSNPLKSVSPSCFGSSCNAAMRMCMCVFSYMIHIFSFYFIPLFGTYLYMCAVRLDNRLHFMSQSFATLQLMSGQNMPWIS